MLDINYILENKEAVEQMVKDREKKVSVQAVIDAHTQLKQLKKQVDDLRQQRNALSKKINDEKKAGKDITQLLADLKSNSDLPQKEAEYKQAEEQYNTLLAQIPNILDDRVPRSTEDRVEYQSGDLPQFPYPIKTNWDVLVDLGLADFKRGIKAAGDRGWVLLGNAARLSRAITNYLLDFWREKGYFELTPPYFVNEENLFITGHYPGGEDQVYRTEDGKVFVGTAEISIMAIYANELFSKRELPLKITAYTPCFRREAGTHADDKGLYRTHQFDKVELIHITSRETVQEEYNQIFEGLKELYTQLELPHRIITLRANDMAGKAEIERDFEVWLPAEKRWAEMGSIGLVGDYQCRRGNIKFDGDGQRHVAQSIYATGGVANRILIAILNNCQQADGTVLIPKVLHSYMGGITKLEKQN